MGLRLRKSFNLGGGFRINVSKSGIGYSCGVKGYRVTKTANGRIRQTASIPGTGISWVDESGGSSKRNNQTNGNGMPAYSPEPNNNTYDTVDIVNNITQDTVSEGLNDIIETAQKSIAANQMANVLIVISIVISFINPLFLVAVALSAIYKIIVKSTGVVDLHYDIDKDQVDTVKDKMHHVLGIMKCDKIWRNIQSSKVIDTRYSAGASSTVRREPCAISKQAPFPFKTNAQIAVFKHSTETLIFLPDKLFILDKGKIGVLDYNDFTEKLGTTRFVEESAVPKDATVVGHTWKYVNKSGGPDRRFKDNRQLPICLYGELTLSSSKGLNTEIMFSKQQV